MAKKKPGAKKAKKRSLAGDLPLPDPRAMEAILREMLGGLQGPAGPETDLDRAQEVVEEAFAASPGEQARLARKALEISPDCADAYMLLAENAKSVDEALEFLTEGVAAGRRALGEEGFEEYAGHFWGFLETRPYMRARQSLAQLLWEMGRREEAAEHFREMLRLNPNDNQGVRYSLATLLLDLDRDEELQRLLAEYKDDASAEVAYTRVLAAFRREGDSPNTRKLLKAATKTNKHVPAYLLGDEQLPAELPPYVSMGGDDEAVAYVAGNRRVWLNTPGAISWLRGALDLPLPVPMKSRRPPWPEERRALMRVPQEDEVWQVDVLERLAEGEEGGEEESSWTFLIVEGNSGRPVAIDFADSTPKPADVLERLVDTIRHPQEGESQRPAKVEVRQKSFHTALKSKLRQIGIECVLRDSLDALDRVRQRVREMAAAAQPEATPSSPEELLSVPQEPGEIWQADIRPLPAWITGEGQPYRPWGTIVLNRTEELVLAEQTTRDRPPAERLWSTIHQAIERPIEGDPHRPGTVEVASTQYADLLRPILDRAGIECVVAERLDHLDFLMDHMARQMAGPHEPPALMDVPGLEPAQVAGFYAAVAEYYRRRPWRQVPGDTIIKVRCDKFQSGPFHAVVMGQSGVQQGIAIYENLASLQRMISGGLSEEENARGMSGLSLMFSEAFEISVRDLDAIERHGWPVAGPEAYPLVMRVNPGMAIRPPLTWELELLEGCLRTIPDFLTAKKPTVEQTVALASGELTMKLSWVER